MPSLDEERGTQRQQILKALERSRLMALESTAWSARYRAMAQISRSKAKSASQTHSTWLSIQSSAIIIVALSGERRVGSVSPSIRKASTGPPGIGAGPKPQPFLDWWDWECRGEAGVFHWMQEPPRHGRYFILRVIWFATIALLLIAAWMYVALQDG
jgi:hypothetical protein